MKEAARAFIIDNNGRVLLGERKKGIAKGEFSLLGGKCDDDETPLMAVVREIGEELPGLQFIPTILAYEIVSNFSPNDPIKSSYFLGTTDTKPSVIMPVKTDEIGGLIFIGPEDITNEGIPIAFDHREVLARFFSDNLHEGTK